MDFGTATGLVLTDLRRPNLTTLVQRKINSTIRLINSMGRFPDDLYEEIQTEGTPGFVTGSYTQSLQLPAGTRVVAYLNDPARTEADPIIRIVDVATVIENPGMDDIAYRAGSVLQTKLSILPTSLRLGVYKYVADLVGPTDTNWILDTFADTIIDYAAAGVWRYVGEKEAAKRLEDFTVTSLRVIVADRINTIYTTT